MRSLLPFDPKHLALIKPQGAQADELGFMESRDWRSYRALGGIAWTGKNDSRYLGCGGLYPVWPGRITTWFLLDASFDRYDLLWLARIGRNWLETVGPKLRVRRIEVTVRQSFRPGHLFVKFMGFEYEGLLRKFDPLGNDHVMYSRIY
jgi:hypothetical protein